MIEQARFPMYISNLLSVDDPVIFFEEAMEGVGIEKYLKEYTYETGRPAYNRRNMLMTILYGFMESGYVSVRELEDRCKSNIRYMYLMNYERPTYHTFSNFINDEIEGEVGEIFVAIIEHIKSKEHIDLEHIYIDGTKIEANANKYTWVWKKGAEKSRYKLYSKITELFTEINEEISSIGYKIEIKSEYMPEYIHEIMGQYAKIVNINFNTFVEGKGHHKAKEQRIYERLKKYYEKLNEYVIKINTCGEERNSYSKTDKSATFMRLKQDYMRNDQLLPAYNIQIGVADEYIVVVDVQKYTNDMDCFVPLMEKFKQNYGYYPKYPVADAGYGSYNNYIYCEEHGMEKFMKFTMYEKETKDKAYQEDPFRASNFKIDSEGNMICPNNKKMIFSYRKHVPHNNYGRQEEIYTCENCNGCPYADKCKKTQKNRTIRINKELTKFHKEVLSNLESVHGALLRMNRSIQAEGTFGIIKYDRSYKRIVRRSINSVLLEIFLVSIGHNLYKFFNKYKRQLAAA